VLIEHGYEVTDLVRLEETTSPTTEVRPTGNVLNSGKWRDMHPFGEVDILDLT
jgi:hypothetical protein